MKRYQIVCDDSIERMRRMKAESIDVIITSPPYNIGLDYNQYKDKLKKEEYLNWMGDFFNAANRILKPNGHLFLNVGGTNKEPSKPYDVLARGEKFFTLQNNIVWLKAVSLGEESFGHFKPINSNRFLNNLYEHVFHFTKTGDAGVDRLAVGVPFKDKSNITRWKHGRDKRCGGNVWFIPYRTVTSKGDRFNHPGTYPPELAVRCLKLAGSDTNKSMKVMDPFVGTGSTLVACKREHISNCIGIDLDNDYCEISRRRLKGNK